MTGKSKKVVQGIGKVAKMYNPSTWREKGIRWTIGLFTVTLIIIMVFIGVIWSDEPETFDVEEIAYKQLGFDLSSLSSTETQASSINANASDDVSAEPDALAVENGNDIAVEAQPVPSTVVVKPELVEGYITTATVIELIHSILNKTGGYITNDVIVPSLYLDNIKNWEFGVLSQIRDMTQVLRNDYSRSQTQSAEDSDLRYADPQLHFDSESWILPSTESEYKKGLEAIESYRDRLAKGEAQFHARADNLTEYLGYVEKRLGSLAQRLASSVGEKVSVAIEGEKPISTSLADPTPYLEIDDIFYEARGYAYGLVHVLKAAAIDFEDVLEKKNALVSLKQIIDELDNTQDAMWSPMVLNGSGFGLVANHSLIMASFISRANAGLIDLRKLLQNG